MSRVVSSKNHRLVLANSQRWERLTHKTGFPCLSMTTDLNGRCVRRACLLIVERIPCSCSAKLFDKKKKEVSLSVYFDFTSHLQSHELAVR